MTIHDPQEISPGPLVTMANAGVRFETEHGPVQALHDVTLTLEYHASMGVIGESGSGKTTLARAIAGIQPLDEGIVRLAPDPDSRKIGERIGMVFQNPKTSLNPRLAIGAILRDPFAVHRRMSKGDRDERIDQLLADVGLPTEIKRRRARHLSGGQLQRAAIARALALSPDLMIADEPTSALDVSIQGQVINTLRSLRRINPFALVLITHDFRVVRALADTIVVMYHGVIVEQGPASAVLNQPAHPYTRLLISSVPQLGSAAAERSTRSPKNSRHPDEPHEGCPFMSRCSRATPDCGHSLPSPRPVRTQQVRCLHPLDPNESRSQAVHGSIGDSGESRPTRPAVVNEEGPES